MGTEIILSFGLLIAIFCALVAAVAPPGLRTIFNVASACWWVLWVTTTLAWLVWR